MKKILPMILMGVSTAFALDDFEAPGYQAGQEVAGKGSWDAEGAVIVSDEQSAEGSQALKIEAGQKAWKVVQSGEGIRFYDVYVLPTYGEGKKTLNLGGAELGFLKDGTTGKILVFHGETTSLISANPAALADDGKSAAEWIRISVRIDGTKKIFDLYLDGKPVYANGSLAGSGKIEATGSEEGVLYLDSLDETAANPLFVDADKDGMPDAEEAAYGLNPFADDREGDLDGDGTSNIQEFAAGTLPQVPGEALPETGVFLFVDNLNGNDTNSGNRSYVSIGAEGPKASIKAAMAAAPSSATIVVLKGKGTYDEGSRGVPGKKLTIKTVEPVTIE